MTNKEIIIKFYDAFSNHNPETMVNFYDDNIEFEDPAFGILKGIAAKMMWKMLIEISKGNLKITVENIKSEENFGSVDWKAEYIFSQTKRKVINNVHAEFEFQNGKIIKHKDFFDFYKWSCQALGIFGFLFGKSKVFKFIFKRKTNSMLKKYILQQIDKQKL